MLEDFCSDNGATQYVPGSHLTRSVPKRNGTYDFKRIEGRAGSIVIMDSGTWHRSGPLPIEADGGFLVFILHGL